MSVQVALLGAVAVMFFLAGMFTAGQIDARMWFNHGYCPTCNRLTCDREHD